MNILLTGGTGLVGSQLGIALARLGHDITALTRKGIAEDLSFPANCIAWDHRSNIPLNTLSPDGRHFDAIIHLAGEPVAQRWSQKAKKRIYESRVTSTKALMMSVRQLKQHPTTWLNASAIGIYGNTHQSNLTEASPSGTGFLAKVCRDWESALSDLDSGIRRVSLRFGIILSSEGGALSKMIEPFRYGLGGAIGDGTQKMSWIHIDDVVSAIIHTLNQPKLSGPINLVAPKSSSNRDFTRTLAHAMKRPAFLPVPTPILRILLGEMSQIVTSGADVTPEALLSSGFNYKFPELTAALSDLTGPESNSGVRVFVARQWLAGSPAERFPFFSAAENLERITPPWLHFKILAKSTPDISVGSLIDYKLRIKGLPVRWRTRIASWDPPKEFSDEQLRGPYKIWHHTHTFEALGRGTLMTDRVLYKMHFWPLGDLAIPMVKNDIRTIFSYRKKFLTATSESTPQ